MAKIKFKALVQQFYSEEKSLSKELIPIWELCDPEREWAYGLVVEVNSEKGFCVIENEKKQEWCYLETLCQYTTANDYNDEEIYSGDLVYAKLNNSIYLVWSGKYRAEDSEHIGFYLLRLGEGYINQESLGDGKHLEVIGNVFAGIPIKFKELLSLKNTCKRCGGLLFREIIYDLYRENTEADYEYRFRCLNCGKLYDKKSVAKNST